MKQTGRVGRRSLFWSRLLGTLIAFAIAAVMVFGGVKNLLGELSAVHEDLAASQSELAVAKYELAETQQELASTQSELSTTEEILASKSGALDLAQRQHVEKNRLIQAMVNEQWDLKRALGEAAGELAQSHRQLRAAENALRETAAELERQLSQPQISVITTSERVYQTSYSERFAASHVRMFAEGDGGMMFYDGQEMLHEVETSTLYAERTQTIVTQTAPGRDVLECLNDGCAMVLAVQYSAAEMQAYAYESQYASMESLVVMEDADRRRGRRPGRRR